ncbi:MAG: ABC transporter permease, partial [Candidatus Brocadiae bacterium]|nr:ABC transporter permease [Candidatus Brocadiia bacterium]
DTMQRLYDTYVHEFGLDRPVLVQFFNYVVMLFKGDLGTSFSQYPTPVRTVLARSVPWSLALQLPALLVGWVVGNVLGAIAAYRKGIFDHAVFPVSLFFNSIPHYALGILLLYFVAVVLDWFPVAGGYDQALSVTFSLAFIRSAAYHYVLPFLSIVLVMVGGQAIGMREMSIYELNSDYVLYCRSLGLGSGRIIGYVFKNAVLPQITGFATSLGMVVGGSLVTEVVFSYPGLGMELFTAIRQSDYPLIQGCTLVITLGVLGANLLMDLSYGLIDPRIRAAELEEAAA